MGDLGQEDPLEKGGEIGKEGAELGQEKFLGSDKAIKAWSFGSRTFVELPSPPVLFIDYHLGLCILTTGGGPRGE